MTDADLSDLDAFVAVAGARSFRGAANRRGGSASALSEAVRRLEARLGVRLLNRTTRSVTATEAGARLLDRLAPALAEVAAAVGDVGSLTDSPSGMLRLNVPGAVARIVLPRLVGPFLKAYPGIVLEISADDSFIDVLAAGFDAGVRYEERLERDMIAMPIGPRRQRFVTAAAPAYLAAHGTPDHPRDLLDQACIRHRFASGATAAWEFERGDETIKISVRGPLIASSNDVELAAAVDGIGIIHTFDGLLADCLADGRLAAILEDWSPSFSGPFLYYQSRRHMPAALRAFIDFSRRHTWEG